MKLTVVGCSGSFAGPDSAASCYLVEASDLRARRTWRLVLDLGAGAFGSLQRHVSPDQVDAVAITHLHADHCADLTGFNVYRRYRPLGPLPPIPLYGPNNTVKRIAVDGDPDQSPSQIAFTIQPWVDGTAIKLGPLTLLPRRVLHPIEAYALRVTGPSEHGRAPVSLVFTGDSDLCPELEELAEGADLLLSEASFVEGRDQLRGMHLTGHRAGQLAAKARVKRLILTHIPPWNDPAAAAAEASAVYLGPVALARSGDVHTL